ncbi:MAG: hypothetical protein GC190_08525 [Alphaproteobacteria bacterium]|nr:hypothetical protein [Alphaproteobacteria bacterium]
MLRYWTPIAVTAMTAALLEPGVAGAIAHTPSISGNSWVAMALLLGFIGLIVLVVSGALHLDRRDARLGRRHDDGALFPIPGGDDDDDFHHHGGHGHF